MTTRAPDWEELRTFREVMREGGLSGAARRLGVAQPTVGRRMDALEAALGVALFARSPRGAPECRDRTRAHQPDRRPLATRRRHRRAHGPAASGRPARAPHWRDAD